MLPHRRIRLAFCIDNLGVGGTELNAVRTAERLDDSRFELRIVCLQSDGPLLARFRQRGIPVHCFPIGRLYGLRTLRQARRLTRLFAAENIDIVHSHDAYNNIFSTVCAHTARSPVIIASRRWWDEVPRRALRFANRQAYRFADCVLTNSSTVAQLLMEREGVPPQRVAIVPNFVDESAFMPMPPAERRAVLARFGVPADACVIGCVASLRPVKDQSTLLRAFARLRERRPELHVMLVGDGESLPALAALVKELGIAGAVHFTGTMPNEPNLHQLFDVSVLCSSSEALPNSILEAMAAARPVVATRVGGIPDAVVDGLTGLLVPPRDPVALGEALGRLIDDPEARRTIGLAAAERARDRFHAGTVIPQLEGLYVRLLSSCQRAPGSSVRLATEALHAS